MRKSGHNMDKPHMTGNWDIHIHGSFGGMEDLALEVLLVLAWANE